MRLENKIAVITGAGSGIGLAAAELFGSEGATVLILDKNGDSATAAKKKIVDAGGRAEAYRVDVADWQAVEAVFARLARDYGGIDVLYNNASVFFGEKDAAIETLEAEVLETILRINLFGLMYCTKYAIPLLRKRGGGVIINTSSSCGLIGIPNCDAYSASKGATVALTRSFAVEYGPENIRCNCIAPAAILTPMVYESDLNKPTFDEQKFLSTGTPLRRWGKPEDIANIALFLAGKESSYLNGAIIVADGGITIA
ncbi:MAG: glucose 1-dehydrogenase [Planctomycetaceae bacterium]|nr:glucose 1-dehydrogenase [Planctomycetaceae bacterium]